MNQQHWLVRPKTIRILWGVFAAVLVATVIPNFFLHPHENFPVEGIFGFYAWYGFGTCVAMVLVSKALGGLLKREEDYYDE